MASYVSSTLKMPFACHTLSVAVSDGANHDVFLVSASQRLHGFDSLAALKSSFKS